MRTENFYLTIYSVLYTRTFSLTDVGVDKLLIFGANWLEHHPTLGLAAFATATVYRVYLLKIFLSRF